MSLGKFFILLYSVTFATNGHQLRVKRETVDRKGCTHEGTPVSSGETKDVDDFRMTCTDGKLVIDGCIYEGTFVAIDVPYLKQGSGKGFNCTKNGATVSGATFFTHCLSNGELVEDKAQIDDSDFRRRCVIADDKSAYSWEIVGCLHEGKYVSVNTVHQEDDSDHSFKCVFNGTHAFGEQKYTRCSYMGKLVADNEVLQSDLFKHLCDVADDGSTYSLEITHCILKNDQVNGTHQIVVGGSAKVHLTYGGKATFACKQAEDGTVSLIDQTV